MPQPRVTVVIPTLAADSALIDCVGSLEAQRYRDFEVIVVDNSGKSRVRQLGIASSLVRIIENERNAGFGAAINQGYRASSSPFVATLNDDAAASTEWLESLVETADRNPRAGMIACRVVLSPGGSLDSAGMLISADGSSKQRGHGGDPDRYAGEEPVLLPSGSAALYRREMLDDTGAFDEDFFLYCEDTDLGLRARWAGWQCIYQPRAVVHHRYSHSAGRASALKAYYVERNRLRVVVKNFPMPELLRSPLVTVLRYYWHLRLLLEGRGAAAQFRSGSSGVWLAWFVVKAHLALLVGLPWLLALRWSIRRRARISAAQFRSLLREHAISAREVAAL